MPETVQASFQAEQLLKHIHVLCDQIGPRPPTSRNERRAAEYVREALESMGIDDVRDQFFTSPETSGWLAAPYLCAGTLAPLLGGRFGQAVGGLVMLGVARALANALSLRHPSYLRMLAQGTSQNVVARIAPAGEIKRRVFLVAHLDTDKARRMTRLPLPGAARIASTTGIALAGLAGVTMLAGALTGRRQRTSIQWLASAACGFGAAALMADEAQAPVAGANDNASGVAVLLGLAQALAAQPLNETEVILLFTGCHAAGAVGLRSYLGRFAPPRYNTYWINVALVGAGRLCYATRQGLSEFTSYRSAPRITALAARIAREHPELGVSGRDLDIVDEVAPLIQHDYEAIGIYGYDDQGNPALWHDPNDTTAALDPDMLTRAARYTLALVQALDASESSVLPTTL